MKTIKLKKITGSQMEVNPMFIEAMEPSEDRGTLIHTMGGKSFIVEETPERIKELAKQLDYFITHKLFENEQIHYPEGK